mgnify:CR=1 FL=1
MENNEQHTLERNFIDRITMDFIRSLNSLTDAEKAELMDIIEWEKEISWSDGYATAEEQIDPNNVIPRGVHASCYLNLNN